LGLTVYHGNAFSTLIIHLTSKNSKPLHTVSAAFSLCLCHRPLIRLVLDRDRSEHKSTLILGQRKQHMRQDVKLQERVVCDARIELVPVDQFFATLIFSSMPVSKSFACMTA